MPPEEIVHGDIPFPAEFEPVEGVPPVRVELPVCEACYLRKSAEDVFEDREEDQQENDHEREEEAGDRFRKYEGFVG